MTEDPQTPPSEQQHEGLLRLHPRWRGIVRFCLTVVATLVLGIAVEKVTEATAKNTVAARAQFAQLQRQALQAIAAVKPSTAFILFMDGVTFSPKSQAAMWHKAEERRVGLRGKVKFRFAGHGILPSFFANYHTFNSRSRAIPLVAFTVSRTWSMTLSTSAAVVPA